MQLNTRYLGLDLPSPILPGASPLCDDPDYARRLEDAGAPALVMSSLFEEELEGQPLSGVDEDAVPTLYRHSALRVDPEDYFDRVFRLKHALSMPVIASLNGSSSGGWLRYAQAIEQAGADALEMNVYRVPTELGDTAGELEGELYAVVKELRRTLAIPVAVKLSPFYTSLPNVAAHLAEAGADAAVLFNRFFQPEIEWPTMTMMRKLRASEPGELNLRLRWCAILSERVNMDFCVTGGVTDGTDVARSIASGAATVQVVTPLMRHGPEWISTLHTQLLEAMQHAGVHSAEALKGRLAMKHGEKREDLVRANYYRLLRGVAKRVRDRQPGAAG